MKLICTAPDILEPSANRWRMKYCKWWIGVNAHCYFGSPEKWRKWSPVSDYQVGSSDPQPSPRHDLGNDRGLDIHDQIGFRSDIYLGELPPQSNKGYGRTVRGCQCLLESNPIHRMEGIVLLCLFREGSTPNHWIAFFSHYAQQVPRDGRQVAMYFWSTVPNTTGDTSLVAHKLANLVQQISNVSQNLLISTRPGYTLTLKFY